MARVPLFRGTVPSKRVVDDELLAHTNAHLVPVDGLFEPAHRVYRRCREAGFVAVLRGHHEKHQQLIPR